jgi:hypothetical protein
MKSQNTRLDFLDSRIILPDWAARPAEAVQFMSGSALLENGGTALHGRADALRLAPMRADPPREASER